MTAEAVPLKLADGREVPVFCANNYLGLSSHPMRDGRAGKVLLVPWGEKA